MGTWYDDETHVLKETISDEEDDDGFIFGDGYSDDRPRSRYSLAWRTGELRDDKRNDNDNNTDSNVPTRTSPRKAVNTNREEPGKEMGWTDDDDAAAADDDNNIDDNVPAAENDNNKDNTPAVGISGSPAGNTRRGGRGAASFREQAEGSSESPAGHTRKGAMAKRAKAQKEQKKRKM